MALKDKNQYHHGNLRQALIDAALLLIDQGDHEKLSLRALAKYVGVSQAAPYRHFSDKDALLIAIACEGFRRLSLQLLEVESDLPMAKIALGFNTYIDFAEQHPDLYRIMYSMKATKFDVEEMQQCHQQSYQILEDQIEEGVKAGLFQTEAKESIAIATWSMVHGYAMLLIDGIIEKHAFNSEQQFVNVMKVIGMGSEAIDAK